MVLVGAGVGPRAESRQSSVEDISVPAGEAVDIFYRYGKQDMEKFHSYIENITTSFKLNLF